MSDPISLPLPIAIITPDGSEVVLRTNPYIGQSLSDSTLRAYRYDLKRFAAWCTDNNRSALPASEETVADYLVAMAGTMTHASLQRRVYAICQAHRVAGYDLSPGAASIRHTLRGIAKAHGTHQRRAAALGSREIRQMLALCSPTDLQGLRDAAILLIGFAGALRRSEITAIDREHLTFLPEALALWMPSSKADRNREGVSVLIPAGKVAATCPIAALRRWIDHAGIKAGPVFRGLTPRHTLTGKRLHNDAIRRIIVRLGTAAGVEIAAHEGLSPHGLRAGFITESYRNGARPEDIMAHTRQTSYDKMRVYIRRSNKMSDHPGLKLDL
jgi:integrase